ncbi:glycosyltransferase family 4 protein [Mariniradius sediminis]|uniref:Glycosyltransferase family 4 protein n=1 Tax=Mariniradius sediminis TaxID=2909237 RepID=A0ABS9BSE5_9BACT|nr:glycosyltransferase family 4 protein [Mariniradius sediminis]MCF1751001.1 glycosyltransferase family 4 protein [Mariniradius sediminis]
MVIYIYPVRTAFTDRDIEMLKSGFKVRPLVFTQNAWLLLPFFLIQFLQIIFLMPWTTHWVCFFGGYHTVIPSFFSRITGKKCVILCGGTDAVNMPSIQYGNYRKIWLKKATNFSFKNCSLILPVADSLVKNEYRFAPDVPEKQGLLNLIPDLRTPIKVIHNGFDSKFWIDFNTPRAPKTFITVAKGISKTSRATVKGIDLIEQIAPLLPECKFTLVGDIGYQAKSANVAVLGSMDLTGLRQILNEHRYYLQLSMSEGFPNALAEAMLCGCIPIGSEVGDVPAIIGDESLVLPQKDSTKLIALIDRALSMDFEGYRKRARQKIVNDYPYSKRQSELIQAVKNA